jgi:hypothetical protein
MTIRFQNDTSTTLYKSSSITILNAVGAGTPHRNPEPLLSA